MHVMDTEGKPLASTLDAVEEYKGSGAGGICRVFSRKSRAFTGISVLKFLMKTVRVHHSRQGETDDVYMV